MKKLVLLMALFLFTILAVTCDADEIKGRITAVDTNAGIIDISGVKVTVQAARMEDENDMPMTFDALSAGDYLEIEGFFSGPCQMMAVKIERDYQEQDEIKGRIESVDAANNKLVISGVTVTISEAASLEGRDDMQISVSQLNVGDYIECDGSWNGTAEFLASKLELD